METPAGIIRDQDGYFHHPDGRPLVIIFDSKNDDAKQNPPSELSWQQPLLGLNAQGSTARRRENNENTTRISKPSTKRLKFVNVPRPGVRGKRAKKTPSVHTQSVAEFQERALDLADFLHQYERSSTVSRSSVPRPPFVQFDPFMKFPVSDMKPYMYTLLYQYHVLASGLSSYGQDLTKWLGIALTDEALFQTILGGSALHSGLATGETNIVARYRHMKEAVRLISKRLQDPEQEITDGTMIAVAHLAIYEVIAKNFINWRLHMDGLYKMIDIRGGYEALHHDVKYKVWRADLAGCIGTLSRPQCSAAYTFDILSPPVRIEPHDLILCSGIQDIQEAFGLGADLLSILRDMQYVTAVIIKDSISLQASDRIMAPIQHRLLLIQPAESMSAPAATVQAFCCMGAFVYLRTVYDFLYFQRMSKYPPDLGLENEVVAQLKHEPAAAAADAAQEAAMQPLADLILWTIFMAGVAMQRTTDRALFVARLVKLVMSRRIDTWEHARTILERFFWVDRIHHPPCRDLWDEVMTTKNVLFSK